MDARRESLYLLVVGATDPETRGCLEAVTGAARFCFDEAANAADAIDMAERRRPALILLNIRERDGSGMDVCRELVAAQSTRDIPILAIAGVPPEKQFMISLAVMPCDTDALDREIRRIIDRVH
jgi:DNA-binding response OmpR family regulator